MRCKARTEVPLSMVEEESKLIGLEVLHVMLQGPINDMCVASSSWRIGRKSFLWRNTLKKSFEKQIWLYVGRSCIGGLRYVMLW